MVMHFLKVLHHAVVAMDVTGVARENLNNTMRRLMTSMHLVDRIATSALGTYESLAFYLHYYFLSPIINLSVIYYFHLLS